MKWKHYKYMKIKKNYQANSCPSRVSATENCDPQNTRTTPKLCNLSITLGAL